MTYSRTPYIVTLDDREREALKKVAAHWGVSMAAAARRMFIEKAQVVHLGPAKAVRS